MEKGGVSEGKGGCDGERMEVAVVVAMPDESKLTRGPWTGMGTPSTPEYQIGLASVSIVGPHADEKVVALSQ